MQNTKQNVVKYTDYDIRTLIVKRYLNPSKTWKQQDEESLEYAVDMWDKYLPEESTDTVAELQRAFNHVRGRCSFKDYAHKV